MTKEEMYISRIIDLYNLPIQTNDLKVVNLFAQTIIDRRHFEVLHKMKADLKFSNNFYYLNR